MTAPDLQTRRTDDGSFPIVGRRPIPQAYGRALSAFIHNRAYFLVHIDVYADGLVECWESVDLKLFAAKLAEGWVAFRPRRGADFAVSMFGGGTIVEAEWSMTAAAFERRVHEVVRELNPTLSNLLDLQGSSTEMRNGVRWAKLSAPGRVTYRRQSGGKLIAGRSRPVLVPCDGSRGRDFELTKWFVYHDGLAQIGYGSELMSFDAVSALVEAGRIATAAPDGSWIGIPGLGRLRLKRSHWQVEPQERIREMRDLLAALGGHPDAVSACFAEFQAYEREPSDDNRERLRAAYEAVPKHLRRFCCRDQDRKDFPIKAILYPEGRRLT
jgi:hypothetical protein